MNYTIPKDRQQAIEIYQELVYQSIIELVDVQPTKYHMFIGALTKCSDEEFEKYKWFTCRVCEKFGGGILCGSFGCGEIRNKLFNKKWNE